LDTGLAHAVTRGGYDAGVLTLALPPDEAPPVVLDFAPQGDAVDAAAAIRVTFSEPMDRASVQLAVYPPVLGMPAWSDDNATLTLAPGGGLATAATYVVTVPGAARDAAGNAMGADFTWTFRTSPSEGDRPHVVSVFPTGNKVPPGKPIIITFDRPMDHASVEAALGVSPDLFQPLKRVEWDGNTLTVRGHRAMEHGTTYAVTLAGSATSAAGVEMGAAYAWSFTTAPGATPPGHAADRDKAEPPRATSPALPKADAPAAQKGPEKATPPAKAPEKAEPAPRTPEKAAPPAKAPEKATPAPHAPEKATHAPKAPEKATAPGKSPERTPPAPPAPAKKQETAATEPPREEPAPQHGRGKAPEHAKAPAEPPGKAVKKGAAKGK
ncbi:MAG TPA: Ig-like domain-containing protein, partial [Candidatus Thermoplasmatota archaeon]|nr:Ig-like domain-containing protein [Candidatus Thermoplasmatota archaeon]